MTHDSVDGRAQAGALHGVRVSVRGSGVCVHGSFSVWTAQDSSYLLPPLYTGPQQPPPRANDRRAPPRGALLPIRRARTLGTRRAELYAPSRTPAPPRSPPHAAGRPRDPSRPTPSPHAPLQSPHVSRCAIGTVTRSHFDSYDNLLCQVAGYKFVRMHAPSDGGRMYAIRGSAAVADKGAAAAVAGGGGDASGATTAQGNVSAVDVEAPDFGAHPLHAAAVAHDALLGPGDVLFIPKGWWHYVRSVTPSFSLNCWF